MKKILAYILLLVMCVSLFAGCAGETETTQPSENVLTTAKELLFAMYKDTNGAATIVDYSVVSVVAIDGVSYNVTWKLDVTSGDASALALEEGENKVTVKILNKKPTEEVVYSLVGTITDGENSETVSFAHNIPAAEGAQSTLVTAPATGVGYKFALDQNDASLMKTLYFTGNMAGYYLETTDDVNQAANVYLEEAEGGYKMYVLSGGAKTYIEIYDRGEGKAGVQMVAEATTIYTWNSDLNILVTTIGENSFYLGCYATYTTMSASNTSYIADTSKIGVSQFVAQLIKGSGQPPVENGGSTGGDNTDATTPSTGATTPSTGATTPSTGATTPSNSDPAADSTLSIKDAIKLGASKEHNTYTTNKYYVKGVITEVYNTQYGNMKIKDSSGNILVIYGTYDSKGVNRYDAMSKKPVAGDTVTVYGVIGQYNDTPQMKNGWITKHTPASGGSSNTPTETTKPAETTKPSGGNSGNSGSSSSLPSKAVLGYPAENKYVSGSHYSYTSSSGKTKMELELTDSKSGAIALDVIKNSDNTVSFKSGSQYLFCDGTDVKFVSSQSDNTKFVLEETSGGYFIKCAVATYYDKAQYLEVYSGYLTCYSMNEANASIYTFTLESATGANGTISGQDGSNNSGSSNNGGSSSGGSSSGSVTPTGTLAASMDMYASANLVSRTADKTVFSTSGITYTNDRASSQTPNTNDPGERSHRAYKSSTIKIEYTGMKSIVITADDFQGDQYMSGLDGMTVDGATITRSGDQILITFSKATNSFQSGELASQIRIEKIDIYT